MVTIVVPAVAVITAPVITAPVVAVVITCVPALAITAIIARVANHNVNTTLVVPVVIAGGRSRCIYGLIYHGRRFYIYPRTAQVNTGADRYLRISGGSQTCYHYNRECKN